MRRSVHCVLILALCLALSLSGALVRSSAVRAAGTDTWTAVYTGLHSTVQALAIDPLTPAILYAGTSGGVFRSTNSGTMSADQTVTGVFQADALPDLTVDTLYFLPVQPTPGGSVTLYFTIHNQGAAPVTADYVMSLYGDGVLWETGTNDDRLTSGASQGWHWPITWPSDTASHTFMVVLDPGNVITESNESNNSASISASASGTAPSITVTSPTDGTVWSVGETRSITWTVSGSPSGIAYFLLGYNVDGGSNYPPLDNVSTAPSTATSYNWIIPNAPSSQCSIVVLAMDSYDNPMFGGFSSGLFTISTTPSIMYTLTTTASPSAGGSIMRSPNAASYASGMVVALSGAPVAGYHFVNWSGDLTGSTSPTTITMTANKSVTAVFAADSSLSLSLSAGWNLISCPVSLPVGSISGLQAVYGYHDGWSVATTLLPGEAYWVQVQNTVTVPLAGTPSTAPVSLTYLAGWQLLGNPFDVPLPVSSIINHGLIITCYSYGPNWGSVNLATGVLEPGKGYWIQLSAATTLTLTHP